jgi:glucose/arabinose dehydrogenase
MLRDTENKMLYKKHFIIIIFSFISIFLPGIETDLLSVEDGLKINLFISEIDSPRQLAEGMDGRIYVGSTRSGKIIAIRDTDGNGVADERIVVADNLTFATGVSFNNGSLYFSEINKIWRIDNISKHLDNNPLEIPPKKLVTDNLPQAEWHGWKWLKHDKRGNLYTNVGAPCNVCLSDDKRYASILRFNNDSWDYIARGVRNSVGFDFHPVTTKLYFVDNGRDWLGDDSPSCELNRVDTEGSFYGFPFKHAKNVLDPEFGHLNPGYDFIDPILELGAHVAPTGVTFYQGSMFPQFQNNLFITLHGSWNRSSKVGYNVLRIVLDEDGNVIENHNFISGWLLNGEVSGRPSSPFIMSDGSILIADDKADVIYRISNS